MVVELIDTAGLRPGGDFIETLAQSLGRSQAEQADLILLCMECGRVPLAEEAVLLERKQPPVQLLATKSDLTPPPPDVPAVSVVTGEGFWSCATWSGNGPTSRARRVWLRA